MSEQVLGQGWATPVTLDAQGEVRLEAGAEKVRQAIRLILDTRRGERVMRPDFGAGLEDFLFEPVGTTTSALIRQRVETALIVWEPRIDVHEVAVDVADRRSGRLHITISYRVRATNTFYNLVYPFFLQEGRAT
ncbi:GPW/gp25 family protein [Ornithinimicrobium pekingense]|uniref:GPW/gp25 family protein n=1 Tax=Ornithinimicrobium pekingense TaxID=384677 RepID=UPI0004925D05|nr:GPW/gp25 family protein [Ornithinimicrobium pekingense]